MVGGMEVFEGGHGRALSQFRLRHGQADCGICRVISMRSLMVLRSLDVAVFDFPFSATVGQLLSVLVVTLGVPRSAHFRPWFTPPSYVWPVRTCSPS